MKKLTKIMIAAAVLLCGFVVTGCGAAETIKEIVDSTHKTWYKYSGETAIDIPLGNDDDSVDSTNATNTTIEEKGSGIITLSSSSLGISVKKKVTFYTDGHMTFEPVEEQK